MKIHQSFKLLKLVSFTSHLTTSVLKTKVETNMLKVDLADLELRGLLPLLECLPPNIMSAKGSCPPKNSAKMSSAERKWKPPKSWKLPPGPPEECVSAILTEDYSSARLQDMYFS